MKLLIHIASRQDVRRRYNNGFSLCITISTENFRFWRVFRFVEWRFCFRRGSHGRTLIGCYCKRGVRHLTTFVICSVVLVLLVTEPNESRAVVMKCFRIVFRPLNVIDFKLRAINSGELKTILPYWIRTLLVLLWRLMPPVPRTVNSVSNAFRRS